MAEKIRRSAKDELGPDAAGQSGDIQGLPDTPEAEDESVEELAEEGNAYEAAIVAGVENSPRPDESEMKTHDERPTNEIPPKYLRDAANKGQGKKAA